MILCLLQPLIPLQRLGPGLVRLTPEFSRRFYISGAEVAVQVRAAVGSLDLVPFHARGVEVGEPQLEDPQGVRGCEEEV